MNAIENIKRTQPHLEIVAETDPGAKKMRPMISAETIDHMKGTLSHLSSSEWNSDLWNVTMPASGRTGKIRFPSCDLYESALLRATALDYLIRYASPDAAQRVVREGNMFLQFLAKNGIRIENIRSSIVSKYIDALEHMSIGNAQRNSRIRAAGALFEICVENDLVSSGVKVVDFSYRFSEPRTPKRAPDRCVIDALDILFFNLENDEIPLIMRVIYLIARLIPNRIAEILAMNVDCLRYPARGVFAVLIPTSKETSWHKPIFNDYNFSMEGNIEQFFYLLIRQQQEAVLQCGDASSCDSDYLFYSLERGRVISDSDFNQFIASLISKHKIRNSDGSYPTVTSHMLRHVTIGERLRSDSYTPEETMVEANHSNLEMTLSYGYMSERDESKHLGAIVSAVINEELGVTDQEPSAQAKEINPIKYARLQDTTPYTRIIPGLGLCINASCFPQYAECIKCDRFDPDPLYLEYFIKTRKIIQKRLEKFAKAGAIPEVIQFEQRQLEIVDAYIERMSSDTATITNIEEGGVVYSTG